MSIKEINNKIKQLDLNNDEYVIVGVSAGPDSMALLHILKNTLTCKIVCAHINHNVRLQSKEEENYLKNYCKSENIIFETYKIEEYHQNNFENEARTKRYQFYESLLNKYKSHNLFLAHHGDDLIETVLMKITRGSNIEGYAGIKEISVLDKYKIIRPLIRLTKEEILKYNKEHNITYYIDNSNEDTKYTRNRFRKNIVPLLKKEDKNIHLKFLKYSNILQEYDNYINYEIEQKVKHLYNNNTLNIELFNKEHPFIKKNIIFYILSQIYNNKGDIIKEKNINDIVKMSESKKPNYRINIPKGFVATKRYQEIIFSKKDNITNLDFKVAFDDYFEDNEFIISKVKKNDSDSNNVCRLNSNEIKLPLYIRNIKIGDTIEVLGLNGKKKIKDIFIDSKINIDKRKSYPLLVDNEDKILWIPDIKKSKYNRKKNEIYDIILTSTKKER